MIWGKAAGFRLLKDPQMHFSSKRDRRQHLFSEGEAVSSGGWRKPAFSALGQDAYRNPLNTKQKPFVKRLAPKSNLKRFWLYQKQSKTPRTYKTEKKTQTHTHTHTFLRWKPFLFFHVFSRVVFGATSNYEVVAEQSLPSSTPGAPGLVWPTEPVASPLPPSAGGLNSWMAGFGAGDEWVGLAVCVCCLVFLVFA